MIDSVNLRSGDLGVARQVGKLHPPSFSLPARRSLRQQGWNEDSPIPRVRIFSFSTQTLAIKPNLRQHQL